jgi:hypothetical protein
LKRIQGAKFKLISFIAHQLINSKTARMIVEGRIIDRATFELTDEVIYLTQEEFINASLGFELVEN